MVCKYPKELLKSMFGGIKVEGGGCSACLGFQSHSNFLLPAGKGEADSASMEIIEAKINKVTPKKNCGVQEHTKARNGLQGRTERQQRSQAGSVPLHSEDLIRVHFYPGED